MRMSTNTSVINIRIDKATKKEAVKTVEKMGLDISTAIKMFLNKLVYTGTMPFRVGVMHDPRYIRQLKREVEWTKKHGKRYTSEELFAEWDRL